MPSPAPIRRAVGLEDLGRGPVAGPRRCRERCRPAPGEPVEGGARGKLFPAGREPAVARRGRTGHGDVPGLGVGAVGARTGRPRPEQRHPDARAERDHEQRVAAPARAVGVLADGGGGGVVVDDAPAPRAARPTTSVSRTPEKAGSVSGLRMTPSRSTGPDAPTPTASSAKPDRGGGDEVGQLPCGGRRRDVDGRRGVRLAVDDPVAVDDDDPGAGAAEIDPRGHRSGGAHSELVILLPEAEGAGGDVPGGGQLDREVLRDDHPVGELVEQAGRRAGDLVGAGQPESPTATTVDPLSSRSMPSRRSGRRAGSASPPRRAPRSGRGRRARTGRAGTGRRCTLRRRSWPPPW